MLKKIIFLILIIFIFLIAGCTPQEIARVGLEIAREEIKAQEKLREEIRNKYNRAIEIDLDPEETEYKLHNFISPILKEIFGGSKLTKLEYSVIPEFNLETYVPFLTYILPRLITSNDSEILKKKIEAQGYITQKYTPQNGILLLIFSKDQEILFSIMLPLNTQEILVGGSLEKKFYELLFFDDFEEYGLGETAPFGPWKELNKRNTIEQHVEINKKIGKVLSTASGGHPSEVGVFIDKIWENYVLMVEGKAEDGRIYFGLTREANAGYFFKFGWGSRVELGKFVGKSYQILASVEKNFDHKSWNIFTIKRIKSKIKIYVNGAKIIDITDEDPYLKAGGIGFGGDYWAYFNNVRVLKY